ncbi:hypothetical protein ACQPV1_12465 [Clostridium neonatale]|uniref:hypothetical protein n=1 Tax=Clostridium neonatale TaxID=137838 RepID=UPI003D32732C
MSNEIKSYKYTKNNLLENKENYFFSQYEGKEFVYSYLQDRLSKIKIIKENLNNKNSNNIYMLENINKENDTFISNEFIVTKVALIQILNNNDYRLNNKQKYILDGLLKRYEITKRIYEKYDLNFEELNNIYCDLLNYILLSSCCLKYYEVSDNLKYLNVSLKINDMLSSNYSKIGELEEKLFLDCLEKEVKVVSDLYEEKGIKL